jgi:cysteine desulfurase
MNKPVYLDNSTITKPSGKALSQMMPYLNDRWGNPTAPHKVGQELFGAIEDSYKKLYKLIGANEKDEFIFTSSGAEAVNHVIASTHHDISIATGKNHFVASIAEEAPALMAINHLERHGCVAKLIPINKEGVITAREVAESITPRTAVLSMSWANGLTGVINPINEISDLCQERGIRFHLDATHVLGKLFFEWEDIGAEVITFNGSHLHAPKGTGGIFLRDGVKLSPFIQGGSDQAGKRAGDFNVPGLVALGVAAQETLENRDLLCTEVARLRDKLETGICESVPGTQAMYTHKERLPNITCILFPGISNEAFLFSLNRKGLYASIGGGNFQQIGLVLSAAGVDEALSHTGMSFSLSRDTTEEDIDRAIEIISETAKKLRNLSQKVV